MSSETTSSIPQKPAKRGRKPKSSGPSDFCKICGCSFAIRLGNFGKTSYISTENLFVEPKRGGVLRRKLADVLVDLGIAVQEDEFCSSRVWSSCSSKARSAASNVKFIKKSLARPIDGWRNLQQLHTLRQECLVMRSFRRGFLHHRGSKILRNLIELPLNLFSSLFGNSHVWIL